MNDKAILEELAERLPELEWKMNSLGALFSAYALPKGLFRPSMDGSATACIAEIKADIQQLTVQKNESSAYYLAARIQKKISVLVALCHLQANKPKVERKINFGLNKISTRQQWLQTLENEINLLTLQQEAQIKAIQQMQTRGDTQALLQLQVDLGDVEKRLTLAKETFSSGTI
jgi:hypothetical protein